VKSLTRVSLAVLVAMVSIRSQAHDGKITAASQATSIVHINPQTILTYILNRNSSVLIGLNGVYQAKEQVNVARGQLLPSINVGAALSSGPSFGLTSISFLLPFLLPSNWYNLDARENQLAANGYAFYLVELNEYASAYGLYVTILSDLSLRDIFVRHVQILEEVRSSVEAAYASGQATQTDRYEASAQYELARAQLSEIQGLVIRERAIFRKMLGLSLKQEIEFETSHLPSLPVENLSPQVVLDNVYQVSPERRQIRSLIAAGQAATFSNVFSFLTGASLDFQGNGTGNSPSFGSLQVSGSAGIGFGYFPSVRLSNLNVDYLRIREREIKLEAARVIESTLGSVRQADAQFLFAAKAEDDFSRAFQGEILSYRGGTTDLLHVLAEVKNVLDASISRVRAQSDLDSQRVNLERIMISGQFGKVPGCRMTGPEVSDGPFGWLVDLFDGSSNKVSVDQICRSAN
jgi:multidrug efflux system outer membrane protein